MMYCKVVFTCGLLLGLSTVTECFNFKDCGSIDVSVMRVRLSPCNTEPCVLVRGKTVRMEIEFEAFRDIAAELHEIRGSSGHGPQVLQFPEDDICAHLTPPCPIKARKFYVLLYRPRVNVNSRLGPQTVRVELVYKDLTKFMCIDIPVQIA
ncbi:Phosphatidylglycerol/phosphatidylinositol transfer protein [Clonorchis sinensis]|uniref:Phosphatidylglycerol/phosphatidylinositol transfer protein n=1 Tax=Clonorchis sinensis TaxID=79923 RepID=A0A3R7DAE9_CLOSI|nr:Phosphatidylglycerol/phosphatidylinositol transfer protein [Clonorchis sinensis]